MLLRDLVAQYGPLLVFANVLAAAIGLPVPAMPTLVLFGAMSAMHPAMIGSQLVTVVALSVLGALIGDTVWYLAGRRFGGTTLKTICRLSLSRDSCVKKTERFFGRYGVRVLAVARFIPGLSLVSVPMAGAFGTRYRTFVGYDALGAALWTIVGLMVGLIFARQIDWLFAGAGQLGRAALLVAAAVLAVYAAIRWMRRRALIRQLASARVGVDEPTRCCAIRPRRWSSTCARPSTASSTRSRFPARSSPTNARSATSSRVIRSRRSSSCTARARTSSRPR